MSMPEEFGPIMNPEHETVVVYKAGSPLLDPARLLRDVANDLYASRELAWRLFLRNTSARYRQSLLGYFWAIFPPLATTGMWLFLTRQQVVKIDSGDIPYPAYLITGMILWQTFAEAIQIPIRVVSESKSMLAKINFPRESLPIVAAAECGFNTLLRLVILAFSLFYLGCSVASTVPLAIFGVLSMILLGLTIGLVLSPFALLSDDINNGLALILQLWMYCTPVIYPPRDTGTIGLVNRFNPVSPLLIQTRDWILTGNQTFFLQGLLVTGLTIIVTGFAFILYRVALPRAIERLST
jgi:lipopolysaccharide transport system permease protein